MQKFIANVECVFRQINTIRKDKVEAINSDDEVNNNINETITNDGAPPVAAPDIYIPDYNIEMPKEVTYFLLCFLISRILVTQKKAQGKKDKNQRKRTNSDGNKGRWCFGIKKHNKKVSK